MNTITIENNDGMRRCEGIDDDELRAAIGQLRVGDHVRFIFLTGLSFQETLPVRVTGIQGSQLHGRLAHLPARRHRFPLQVDAHITLYRGTDSLDRRYTLPSGSLLEGTATLTPKADESASG